MFCPHPILRDLGGGHCPVCPRDEAIAKLTGAMPDEQAEEPGRVYFLATRDRAFIKIGKTRSAGTTRYVKLAGQSPVPVDLIAEIDGYTRVEKRIHDQYRHYHAHGEWFRFEGTLRLFVEAIVKTGAHPCITERELDRGKLREPAPLQQTSVASEQAMIAQTTDAIKEGMEALLPTLGDFEAERCRRSLAYFVRRAWECINPGTVLHWNWHLEEICKHVQAMLEEWIKAQLDPGYRMKAQNLIVNCPPRSLKSTIVSVCAPAWMWLRWPEWKAIFVSANPRVAVRDARGCRALIESPWYQALKALLAERFEEGSKERERFSWTLDPKHNADTDFANTAGGVRMAMGFTAIVVGLGGDAIFVDDPNDMKKVVSEAERSKINDTWDLSLHNRVNDFDRSIRVMIMQRGHELDLTGHWIATMSPKKLVTIVMPLEHDPELVVKSPFGYHDPRTRKDECLHTARFSQETIDELKGKPGFSAQYNQKPVPDDGLIFMRKWWRFCTFITRDGLTPLPGHVENPDYPLTDKDCPQRPRGCDTSRAAKSIPWDPDVVAVTIDATFGSLEDTASNVGALVVVVKGADRYVIADRTKARDFNDTCDLLRDLKKEFPTATLRVIEKKANGAAVINRLESEIGGLVPIENNENYAIRWNAMSPSVRAGNWYLLEHAPWLSSFVAEFAGAPKGAKDDRIDAASTLEKHLNSGGYVWADW
jgi:predicted phage terminase large subunit-like protein